MADVRDEQQQLSQLDALGKRMGGRTDDDGALPDMEERQAPGFLRFMPEIIKEFWAQKAYVKMEEDGSLSMEGFYKNGPMRLEFRGEQVVAVDKRGRDTPIASFDDLVKLNFFWWKQSNTKNTYVDPGRPWVDQFIERKWVKRKVIFQPAGDDDDAD